MKKPYICPSASVVQSQPVVLQAATTGAVIYDPTTGKNTDLELGEGEAEPTAKQNNFWDD